jgi:hypothetical protein
LRNGVRSPRRTSVAGLEPLAPRRKWRAILLATLLLTPAYWSLVAGLVATGTETDDAPVAAPYIAFGLVMIPFVFVVLAFLSEHPRAPSAVVKAMALAILVGIPISALAADAVTGLVAGLGAGGIAALRADVNDDLRRRVIAVVIVSAVTFVLLRSASVIGLLVAPALPFASLGVADHLSERRALEGRA